MGVVSKKSVGPCWNVIVYDYGRPPFFSLGSWNRKKLSLLVHPLDLLMLKDLKLTFKTQTYIEVIFGAAVTFHKALLDLGLY